MRLTTDFSSTKRLSVIGGASLLAMAIALPAVASVGTAQGRSSVDANRFSVTAHEMRVADEDESYSRPSWNDDDRSEHERHEEREQALRARAHDWGERQEDRAERLKNQPEQERAEHERHEMNEDGREHSDD